jgi:eukaryotic-like serine/threonine-protein kinase
MMALGSPTAIIYILKHYKYREKELELRARQMDNPKLLTAAVEEKKQLEARLQNLESIVCSVDFELNQRLNKLTTQSQMFRLEAPAPGMTMAETSKKALGGESERPAAYTLGHLATGQVVLGRYTVERELGRGGMGAVYLARDAKLGERVALKTISSVLAHDPGELTERFRREVQAARRVTHPNVIRIHDLGEDGPLLFLSMEYVEGDTLYARVKRDGALDVTEGLELLGKIAAGVAAAHAAGVVHRDLKPQNVLLGAGNTVKVIDFGLAKTSFSTGMTATGLIMGTPEYMAPEQVRGRRSDARTDVYALGALAYFVLAGRAPFVGDTPIAIGFAHVHEPVKSPRDERPEIPAAVEAVILRALSKDPAQRFADAAAWAKALPV